MSGEWLTERDPVCGYFCYRHLMAVIEIAVFRTTGSDDAFLAADRAVQTQFFYQQPGLVRRTTARNEDGDWLVVNVWQSSEAANAADEHAKSHPAATAFSNLVDGASLRTRRFETLD